MIKSLYRAAWALALPLARIGALLPGKTGRTVRGRLGALRDIQSRAPSSPSLRPSPLLWFHAASVGEGRQALAVITEVKAQHPDWRFAFTFSSSSAETFARGLDVELAAYLPPDTPGAAGAALETLKPAALVFAATDVWPELVRQAGRRRIGVALVSANLGSSSSRLGFAARAFLGDAYRALDAVGAIDERDARLLESLGVPRERITVTGDSRHDAVLTRAAARAPEREAVLRALAPEAGAPILVAGSTWPSDEAALFGAIRAVRQLGPLRLVIAPHEPSAAELARLASALARALGPVTIARLGELERTGRPWDVCLVDRVGVLFDCYAAARIAYVGGGFHAAGLHSVAEPAAFGVPVLFGPRRQNSRDARLLVEAGGGTEVQSAASLATALSAWQGNEPARAAAGAAARAVVEHGAGAAQRSARLVAELVEHRVAAGR